MAFRSLSPKTLACTILLSLVVAAVSQPRRLQAKQAQVKPAAAKALALPPLKFSCKTNRITGWKIPYIVWNCRMNSTHTQQPFCLKLTCANVNTGDCPKPGTGQGTNTVPPEPCGWGLVPLGDGTCVTKYPVFPYSDSAYGFTIDSRLPLSLKPVGFFRTNDSTCQG